MEGKNSTKSIRYKIPLENKKRENKKGKVSRREGIKIQHTPRIIQSKKKKKRDGEICVARGGGAI